MAVYAVGDIQGCYHVLKKLLKKVAFDPAKDVLWCVGDLVNRGPDSLKTLRFLKGLGDACVCVLGNHDLHLLELASGETNYNRDTLNQVLEADDCDALIEWLRHRPILHHDKELGWAMVHAGLHPGWSLKQAKKRAANIEAELQGKNWSEFCHQLHHVKFPISEPKKLDPAGLLFATAVFTRNRYCTSDGLFNWKVKTGESSDEKDRPWFKHASLNWRGDAAIVYGHWAAKGLVNDQEHVLGLDTGCVWGNQMTLAKLKSAGRFKIVAQVSSGE